MHNVVINARLPHSTRMASGGYVVKSTLHFYMNHEIDQDCMSMIAEITDMEECQINLKIHDWDKVSTTLEKIIGKSTPSIDLYRDLKKTMDPTAITILMKTIAKVKVTHFGAVMVIFSWPKPEDAEKKSKKRKHMIEEVMDEVEQDEKSGPLPWSASNTKMVHTMVMMVLQLLELVS